MIPPTFPSAEQLRPALEKLEGAPGSVILLAIERAEPRCNFCRVTVGWFSADERKALRRALGACRQKRQKGRRKNEVKNGYR
jgi:hypothetical protein